ncbi:hypothetical protein PV325_007346 [Microctonus aethiopoides]|nr:hypothetical protein PV325_007346 [Microctonus aethiopoides]KAK0097970.1 hypothetical protein PV326_012093 [Microctonus aethiopoides]
MTFMKKINCITTNYHHGSIILIYIWFVALFAIALFLYGFFPVKYHEVPAATLNDIPKSINNIKINSEYLYKPLVQKVVFMVIDALRWDFINDAHKLDVMSFTRNSIINNLAGLSQVKVNAPTVTMPRVKAMTSGAVSSFIDVVLNFGKSTVTTDNVLLQAKNHYHNIIFYGDDTWLKLYPNIFNRFDGTTSFFVSDYTEVDHNVTRHLNDELHKNNDWSIMILHYLGLDHIGHVYGPQSPLVKIKLNEMDEVIRKIALKIQEWNANGVSSLFIVCGDHGMKNSGGHGGATPEETLVPLVAFGLNNTPNIRDNFVQIEQVDIATTLAVILGVPIPSSSIGSVSLNMINNLSPSNKLFILYYNAKCIFAHYQKLSDYQTQSGYLKYLRAIEMHSEWLNKSRDSFNEIDLIINQYKVAMNEMKDLLVQSMIHYNVTIMSAAIILMGHVINVNFIDTVTTIVKIFFLLVMHRVLRRWNSTGNKFAHLPDINTWLKEDELNILMSLTVIIALILLVAVGVIVSNAKYRKINLVFYLIISSCIYLHHASSNAVIKPLFYPESSGINEVQIFWIAVMGFIIYSSVCNNIISHLTSSQSSILCIIIQLWIMISALLHRPHNIILLPMQLITCKIMCDSLKSNSNKEMKFYVNYCVGNVFYFYQGNSNSLATVDVAAGYVGLQSFILPITTIFICINTFSAPILAYLMTLHDEMTPKEIDRT